MMTDMPPPEGPDDEIETLSLPEEAGRFSLEESLPADSAIAAGVAVIRGVAKSLPLSPGVYRMLNAAGDVLYVGKARQLKNRVTNYTNLNGLSTRIRRMVAETASMIVVTTHTEVDALLLESNLIKTLRPRYNVLLRDDKSFPYIHLRSDHPVPQLTKHRGARDDKGEYFGPFASAGAVNRTITALHRAFLLRSCSDAIFTSRTRPCLQYQIKRCSAPCVDRISGESYLKLVAEARDFLTGRSTEINQRLAHAMMAAAEVLDYERAAELRNRLRALAQVQADQTINVDGIGHADVIAAHQEAGQTCIQVFFFRNGQNWGNRVYFPSHDRQMGVDQVLAAFIGQFYANKPPPPLILLSDRPADSELLAEALGALAGHKVAIQIPQRRDKLKLVDHALINAREALARHQAEATTHRRLLDKLGALFGIEHPINRIEVYDNSHIQGAHAIGAMIVAGPEGFIKSAYRKFTIKGAVRGESSGAALAPDAAGGMPYRAGDDYAMMDEVLTRRFQRGLDEGQGTGGDQQWPDLVLIDGGAGQLGRVAAVFDTLGITDVTPVAIAKGPDRNAGRERFFRVDRAPFSLDPKDPVLYYLQRLRDEAHRFAIGTHRAKRQKAMITSPLDEVPGIGPARKKALLMHFGSARAVQRAGLSDLEQVPGINKTVARKIYDFFQDG